MSSTSERGAISAPAVEATDAVEMVVLSREDDEPGFENMYLVNDPYNVSSLFDEESVHQQPSISAHDSGTHPASGRSDFGGESGAVRVYRAGSMSSASERGAISAPAVEATDAVEMVMLSWEDDEPGFENMYLVNDPYNVSSLFDEESLHQQPSISAHDSGTHPVSGRSDFGRESGAEVAAVGEGRAHSHGAGFPASLTSAAQFSRDNNENVFKDMASRVGASWAGQAAKRSFAAVMRTAIVLLILALLAWSGTIDMLTDLVTAIDHGRQGHTIWCTITVLIVFISNRFMVLFYALPMKPTLKNLCMLTLPGVWMWTEMLIWKEGPLVPEFEATLDIFHMAENGREEGGGNEREDESAEHNPVRMPETSVFNVYIRNIFDKKAQKSRGKWCRMVILAVWFEIQLVPVVCLAIVPMTQVAWNEMLRNLLKAKDGMKKWRIVRACSATSAQAPGTAGSRKPASATAAVAESAPDTPATMASAVPPGEEEPFAPTEAEQLVEVYQKTVFVVEAILESLPQIILQLRVHFYSNDTITPWVFFSTFSLSIFSLLKAVAVFVCHRDAILKALDVAQRFKVVAFAVTETGFGPPDPSQGWKVASSKEVRANLKLLRRSMCLEEWYIATLSDDMRVGGPGYGFSLTEAREEGHVLYALPPPTLSA